MESVGYFVDLTQPPIGGRPVISRHNQTSTLPVKVVTEVKDEGVYGCKKPYWEPKCK